MLGGDQRGARAFALDDRVDDERRAVDERADVRSAAAGVVEDAHHALLDGLRGILGGREELADLDGAFTPNDAFFVRYHLADIPEKIDAEGWRIEVGGEAATTPLALTLAALRREPGGDTTELEAAMMERARAITRRFPIYPS